MTALSWSVLVIGAALTVLLFGFGVRRLIGVRLPPLRTLAAAIIAVLVFSPIVTAMIGGPAFPKKGSALPVLWFVILGVVIALRAGRHQHRDPVRVLRLLPACHRGDPRPPRAGARVPPGHLMTCAGRTCPSGGSGVAS